jgi:amino acid adenylation domain-containing protein
VIDGSSLSILFQELATLYEAFSEGKPPPLPRLPLQYADYAVWQREHLQGEVLQVQLDYWKNQLGGNLPPLNLPADHSRPAVQTFRGARHSVALSEQETKAVKELSRREGVTLFMTLLAAFKILLCRHTGQENVVVGSTIAGRNRPEIEGLIGFFINALVLRTDLSGSPSFLTLLRRVREVCLGAYTHQDIPFDRIVEEINPARDLSRNPLFQVMFNMADTSERLLKLEGCQINKLSYFEPEAKFDITLYAPEKNGRIELAIVYNTDLFGAARIVKMLDQLQYLLSQVVVHPEESIDWYSLVPPAVRAILPDPTEALDETWEGSIQTFLSKQAARVPDRLAVVDPNNAWTYGELDARSNQLAHYLSESGIQRGDKVAIYAHRSCPLVWALLGVLKAGAAFFILDPAYPVPRLIDYLRIGGADGWLQIEGAGALPEALEEYVAGLSCRLRLVLPPLATAMARGFLAEYSTDDPGIIVGPDDPAYLAFTSGSTGQPKGVLGRHGPITHFLPWQENAWNLKATDRFSLLSGLSYSHLHRDVFTSLFMGATLHIPHPGDIRSPERLADWLERNAITILHLTPALGQLLRTVQERTVPSVRRVFFGGDVLTWHDVAQTREFAPNASVVSFYGATETQRAVGHYDVLEKVAKTDDEANQAVPLGRGVKDVQLLMLNPGRQLAGIGELGELYVRSPHLAEGYIGDDELTREMFLQNPFTGKPVDRLYRTGELGRYMPDGHVELVGRRDRRVNIRGFRVELAEIEAVLRQHPAIKENAVVTARDDERSKPGRSENLSSTIQNPKMGRRLVAYIVARSDRLNLTDEVRGFLAQRLPDYMVPSYVVLLDRLPLTPNGKVDYEALAAEDPLPSASESATLSPRTDVESALSEIFAEVLGIDRVGLYDNFFHLGGHSLLAAQVASRIRESFHVGIELRSFLEAPTVAALAKQVEVLRQTAKGTSRDQEGEREEIEL